MNINDAKTNRDSSDNRRLSRLTLKQQRFADSYIRNGGDGAQAVIDADYNVTNRSSGHAISCENLKKPLIRLELERQGYNDCGLISSDAIVKARKLTSKATGLAQELSVLLF